MSKKLKNFIISFFIFLFISLMLSSIIQMTTALKKNKLEKWANVFSEEETDNPRKTEDTRQEYIDKTVFFGESTTYGLQRYGVLSGGTNTKNVWTGASVSNGRASCAGTISISPSIAQTKIFYPEDQSAITLNEALQLKRPEYLIITLGLNNGASYYTESQFKECYRLMLNSISSNFDTTKVMLQSIFPVSRQCSIKAYTPQRISECNKWIKEIALEFGLDYLNTVDVLQDAEGYLLEEYDNGGDGIHLNFEGLNAAINYIKAHGYEGKK